MTYRARIHEFDSIRYKVDSFCHRLEQKKKEIPVTISKGIILRGEDALKAREERELQKVKDRRAYHKARMDEHQRNFYRYVVPIMLICLAIIVLFILDHNGVIDLFGPQHVHAIQNAVHHLKV